MDKLGKRLLAVVLAVALTLAAGLTIPVSAKSSAPGPNGKWKFPLNSTDLGPGFLASPNKASDGYGSDGKYFGGKRHAGLDLMADFGEPVFPVAPGTIIEAWEHKGYGKDFGLGGAVLIEHKNKYEQVFYAVYGHIDITPELRGKGDYAKPLGKKVTEETQLGTILDFGENGDHLHLGISTRQQIHPWAGRFDLSVSVPTGWVDPVDYLNHYMDRDAEPQKVTLHFNANGGWFAPKEITADLGGVYVIPKSHPMRIGYHLLGWSRSFDAAEAEYNWEGACIKAYENLTLYAVWGKGFRPSNPNKMTWIDKIKDWFTPDPVQASDVPQPIPGEETMLTTPPTEPPATKPAATTPPVTQAPVTQAPETQAPTAAPQRSQSPIEQAVWAALGYDAERGTKIMREPRMSGMVHIEAEYVSSGYWEVLIVSGKGMPFFMHNYQIDGTSYELINSSLTELYENPDLLYGINKWDALTAVMDYIGQSKANNIAFFMLSAEEDEHGYEIEVRYRNGEEFYCFMNPVTGAISPG
ncbi:MAG: peptidoglycan DD-metalloendopeptidase family protein [Oscillospiraceae bacterium]|nr:peptidoglycan DD-metalloendopeptidase family protein [Oscillospiraceae bacterium]